MSLRVRLALATIAVVAVGLLVAGFATYGLMRSFLVDRVDQQLRATRFEAARALQVVPDVPFAVGTSDEGPSVPAGTWAAVLDARGAVVSSFSFTFGDEVASRPRLPAGLPGSAPSNVNGANPGAAAEGPTFAVFSADAVDQGGDPFRVSAVALVRGGTLVVAIPLTEVSDTLGRLVAIELGVSAVVLAAAGALAWWTVRLGLRSLVRMQEAAAAIAAGDLSRRVEPANARTEVGRLGRALNAMLGRIEDAFAERRAAEERLRRFVADASHELRTPLTSVQGYAELFRRGAVESPDELAAAMRRIEGESARMSQMVDELLLLARLDQGRPLERERVDLVEVAAAAVDAARAAALGRRIDLDAAERVVVLGDAGRLRQVLDNLLSNARHHTPEGTPIHVRVAAADGHGVVEVADEGPGIAEADAGRVFERFFRADRARSPGNGGAGLGLSIVAAVAEAHGGRAWYRPRPGGGSVFEVSLPLAVDLPAAP
jgi:two-component system OmpR family sensor kinase